MKQSLQLRCLPSSLAIALIVLVLSCTAQSASSENALETWDSGGCLQDCLCSLRRNERILSLNCTSSHGVTERAFVEVSKLNAIKFDQIELIIEGRGLSHLPKLSAKSFSALTRLFVSGNKITELRVENLPPNIKVVELHENRLSTLNDLLINFLKSSSIERLTLHRNPWNCVCSNWDAISFIQGLDGKTSKTEPIRCGYDGQELNTLKEDDFCPSYTLVFVFGAICLCFVVCFAGCFYFKHRIQMKAWMSGKTSEEETDEKLYDAFISYSHFDKEFVAEHLISKLENTAMPYKLCIHERDWIPDMEISTQISKSINEARRIIIVMSPKYLQSKWSMWELKVAQSQAATQKQSRIIMILYKDIGDFDNLPPEVRNYMKLNTNIEWSDACFWEKLKSAMPHRNISRQLDIEMTQKSQTIA